MTYVSACIDSCFCIIAVVKTDCYFPFIDHKLTLHALTLMFNQIIYLNVKSQLYLNVKSYAISDVKS